MFALIVLLLQYAELINIQRRLGGKESFPLIEQTFYPTFKEMVGSRLEITKKRIQTDLGNFPSLSLQVTNPPKFPCVIKLGHFHAGLGKLRVDSLVHFQELLSVLACISTYITVEPFIDAKCDIHIQKIGNNYKAFM